MTATPARRRPGGRVAAATVAAALVVPAVLGLTGCDPNQVGSAATVGDVRITERSIQQDAQSVLDVLSKNQLAAPATDQLLSELVRLRIDNRVFVVAAQREGIVVTQGQIESLIAQAGGRDKLEVQFAQSTDGWVPPAGIDDAARSYLIQQQLGQKLAPGQSSQAQVQAAQKYFAQLAAELGVTVSPRYGAWDEQKGTLVAPKNDLSSPVASPSTSG